MRPITRAEINTGALRGNILAIRQRTGGRTPVCAAVKADAYGHGVSIVLPVLIDAGIERVAVATLDEAAEVRQLGWDRPLLCLGAPLAEESPEHAATRAAEAVAMDVSCTVSSPQEARLLAEAAGRQHHTARLEIKIDSGMGRMGLSIDRAIDTIGEISRVPGAVIEGVYTHFATADEQGDVFAAEQLAAFLQLRERVRAAGIPVGAFHAANSAGIFRLPQNSAHLDMVRPGICLYGYWDCPAEQHPEGFRPAMRVVSRVVAIRPLPEGHAVGYGRTFVTGRDSLIGVVPIGYADGYRRLLSNRAVMSLEAIRSQPRRTVPVVGRISMDQTTIDLTAAGDVRVGDPIIVIDDDPAAPNSIEAIARQLDTISYEITCLIGQRVARVAV